MHRARPEMESTVRSGLASPAPGAASRRRARRLPWGLLAVLGLAAALRLIPFVALLGNGGTPLIGDEGNYVEAALALAHGQGIPDSWVWIRVPGYMVFLAAVFVLTHDSFGVLHLVQIAVSLLTIALTYGLVLTAVGGRQSVVGGTQNVALLAAAILAVQPSLILASGLFLTETVFLALITGIAWALVAYLHAARARQMLGMAAGAGVLAGAALMVRSSLIPLLGIAGIALLAARQHPWPRRAGALGLFLAGILLFVIPWTARNALHYDRFLPLDTSAAYTLWVNNSDLPPGEINDRLYAVENPADRGNVATREALAWMAAHPDRLLSRSLGRFVDSLAPDPFIEYAYPVRDKFPGGACLVRDAYSLSAWWAWVLLFGVALGGWLLAPRDALWWVAGGLAAGYIATGTLTHNEYRFRYQIFSFLAIYAASGLRGAWSVDWSRRLAAGRAWRLRLGQAALFGLWLLATWPTFWPGFARTAEATGAMQDAAVAQAAGRLAAAQAGYERAARLEVTCAAVRRDLGVVHLAQGHIAAAAAAWGDALAREPGDWRTRALLIDLARRQGQAKRATTLAREVPPAFNAALLSGGWDLDAPAPLTLTAGLDDVGFLRGFHVGEEDATGAYRWAGPGRRTSIRLRTPAAEEPLRISLVLLGLPQAPPLPPARPVAVFLAETPLTTLQVRPGWNTYTVDLPPDPAARPGEVVLTFDSPPQQASDQDPRYLSFALRQATLGPAP